MRLSRYRWLVPVPAACALQAVFGLMYASAVFVALLDSVDLTRALGVSALFTSLGITLFGVILHAARSPEAYRCAPRRIALVGALGVAAQAGMAVALRRSSAALLYSFAVVLGLGSGCLYVVSVAVLLAWVPESPGVVTGAGMLCAGLGSVFGVYAFGIAASVLGGAIPAMFVTGVLSGLVSLVAAIVLENPPQGWEPAFEDFGEDEYVYDDEKDPLLQPPHKIAPGMRRRMSVGSRMSVQDTLTDPPFYLLLTSFAAAVGPGFGLVLAFPTMAMVMFGEHVDAANQLFFWVTVAGVCGRLVTGAAIDIFNRPSSCADGSPGVLGAKRINTYLLVQQCVALATMPFFIRHGMLRCFTVAAAAVYITFCGGAVVSACLARAMYSATNATLAFALLGIAIGVGDVTFSWLVAACAEHGSKDVDGFAGHVRDYDVYLYASLAFTLLGVVASHFVSVSKSAYQEEASHPLLLVLPDP